MHSAFQFHLKSVGISDVHRLPLFSSDASLHFKTASSSCHAAECIFLSNDPPLLFPFSVDMSISKNLHRDNSFFQMAFTLLFPAFAVSGKEEKAMPDGTAF